MAKKSLIERLKEKKTKLSRNNGKRLITYPEQGTTRYRVLPPGPEKDFSVELITMYIPDAGEGEQKSHLSPASFGEKCAVMEAYNKLAKSKKEVDMEMAKKMRPKRKQGMAVIKYADVNGKNIDADFGVKILAVPNSVVGELIDYYTDPTDGGDFTDPVQGADIKVTRTGEKLNTEYSVRVCKPTKLSKEYAKQLFDPEAMVREILPTYDESVVIAEKIFGSKASSSTPAKKKKKKVKKS